MEKWYRIDDIEIIDKEDRREIHSYDEYFLFAVPLRFSNDDYYAILFFRTIVEERPAYLWRKI